MTTPTRSSKASDTKGRIIDAAQRIFAEKGYSQTGLREIAERAGVVSSLLVKYYGTKAKLFEAALEASLGGALRLGDKAGFGEILVSSVLDPAAKITTPAMIALSLGDEEARDIAAKVAREKIIAPMAEWLGSPHGEARAASTLLLSIGFAILNRHMETLRSAEERLAMREWLVRTMQSVVDGPQSA